MKRSRNPFEERRRSFDDEVLDLERRLVEEVDAQPGLSESKERHPLADRLVHTVLRTGEEGLVDYLRGLGRRIREGWNRLDEEDREFDYKLARARRLTDVRTLLQTTFDDMQWKEGTLDLLGSGHYDKDPERGARFDCHRMSHRIVRAFNVVEADEWSAWVEPDYELVDLDSFGRALKWEIEAASMRFNLAVFRLFDPIGWQLGYQWVRTEVDPRYADRTDFRLVFERPERSRPRVIERAVEILRTGPAGRFPRVQ